MPLLLGIQARNLNPWDIGKKGVQDHGAKGIVGNRGVPVRSGDCSRQSIAAYRIVRIQSKDPKYSESPPNTITFYASALFQSTYACLSGKMGLYSPHNFN